jgi:hypothetical protein
MTLYALDLALKLGCRPLPAAQQRRQSARWARCCRGDEVGDVAPSHLAGDDDPFANLLEFGLAGRVLENLDDVLLARPQ